MLSIALKPDACLLAQALGALCADRPHLVLSQSLDFGLRQVVTPPPTKLPRSPRARAGGASGALAEVAALAAPGGLTATLAQLTSRVRDTGAHAGLSLNHKTCNPHSFAAASPQSLGACLPARCSGSVGLTGLACMRAGEACLGPPALYGRSRMATLFRAMSACHPRCAQSLCAPVALHFDLDEPGMRAAQARRTRALACTSASWS